MIVHMKSVESNLCSFLESSGQSGFSVVSKGLKQYIPAERGDLLASVDVNVSNEINKISSASISIGLLLQFQLIGLLLAQKVLHMSNDEVGQEFLTLQLDVDISTTFNMMEVSHLRYMYIKLQLKSVECQFDLFGIMLQPQTSIKIC